MRRCGSRTEGYECLTAASTGVAYWKSLGRSTTYSELLDGSLSGNPGAAPEIQELINKLKMSQKCAGVHIVTRAYHEMHEDGRTMCHTLFNPQISDARNCLPNVDHSLLQYAVIDCCQFGAAFRADEILDLTIENLFFPSDQIGTKVGGVIPITKNNRRTATYLLCKRAVHRSFCLVEKLLCWSAVTKSHDIRSGPIFVSVIKNVLQDGKALQHRAYAQNLFKMSTVCGIPSLGEHSACRGGLGYSFYVLGQDL